jgi:hypothetical protein
MEATGDLVAAAAKFSSGVKNRENNLCGGLSWVLRVGIHRDSPAVVADLAASVFEYRDADLGAVPRHGFVDTVIDDFPDEMVEARWSGGADVHSRTLPDGFEALEDRDVTRTIRSRIFGLCLCHLAPLNHLERFRNPGA